ncbi:glycosyltransferase [Desulfosporosinus meridiei]|uniref:Glycosyltransferase n=1 Tax=Desulfosporosinus meridiei (strain ATCC BAA-275 / DSM 13257 / KCTC 12902 / NCIMB 13706 / S10) TaxID=768704 RepID=J7J0U9_DESMD|nr:glycosyltransferase [Desulfosporosinus meridiei]AFQ45984.1 hypothetical protein Desmer_4155 [Desulfosporosinus meridiei DSM 13257]
MRFLSISPVIPYERIGHAGGKTYNYYIKRLAAEPGIEVSILGFSRKSDLHLYDLEEYQIPHTILLSSGSMDINVTRVLVDAMGKISTYGALFSTYKKTEIMKHLAKLSASNASPDVIELEWTDFALLATVIYRTYPKVKLIASEHDVSFLGAERKYLQASGYKQKRLKSHYMKLKKAELSALNCCSVVMPHSYKDKALLVQHGIDSDRIHVLTPYFHDMRYIVRTEINHDILFWGAMYRPENYEAAIWFVENVMPLLVDKDVRFIVAGNRPPAKLIHSQSEKVIVTGFVEDETPYFAHSMCFVSPLLTGAGIKVKVIEALSAGIPILTNDIGIEGIPAENGVSYFRCIDPVDYATIICKLLSGEIDLKKLLENQHEVIERNFNLEQSVKDYVDMVKRTGNGF